MIKHTYRWIVIVSLLLLALVGCSTQAASSATPASGGELSPEMTLIVGTLQLEGTDQAVTAEQAAELLPLWRAFVALATADGTADAELDALVDQIDAGMTDAQHEAIAAMALSSGSGAALMQALGLVEDVASTDRDGATVAGPGAGGGGMGVPGSGPGAGDIAMLSPEEIATRQAERQAEGGNRSALVLAQAIVSLLQERVA